MKNQINAKVIEKRSKTGVFDKVLKFYRFSYRLEFVKISQWPMRTQSVKIRDKKTALSTSKRQSPSYD